MLLAAACCLLVLGVYGSTPYHRLILLDGPRFGVSGEMFPHQPAVVIQHRGPGGVWELDTSIGSMELVVVSASDPYGAPGVLPLSGGGVTAFAAFSKGMANFTSLYLNRTGATLLNFWTAYAVDVSKLGGVAPLLPAGTPPRLLSKEFYVHPGAPKSVRLLVHPGDTSGGTPFSPQPVVGLVDAGGSQVSAMGCGRNTTPIYINASLATPAGGVSLTQWGVPVPWATAPLLPTGLATWSGLSINRAGVGYQLVFQAVLNTSVWGVNASNTTTLTPTLNWPVTCTGNYTSSLSLLANASAPITATIAPPYLASRNITVRVGVATRLAFSALPPTKVTSGVPWTQQPRVRVLDAGGNPAILPSGTCVAVSVFSHPVGSSISGGSGSSVSPTLGPRRVLHPIPSTQLRATVRSGERYLYLSGNLSAALGLRPGDCIALGGVGVGGGGDLTPLQATSQDFVGYFTRNSFGVASSVATTPWLPPPYSSLATTTTTTPCASFLRAGLQTNPSTGAPSTHALELHTPWGWGSVINGQLARVDTNPLCAPVSAVGGGSEATFTGLVISGGSGGYTLSFSLAYPANATTPTVAASATSTLKLGAPPPLFSPTINTLVGPPAQLLLRTPAGGAWAGGSPFTTQPTLQLCDATGNPLLYLGAGGMGVTVSLGSGDETSGVPLGATGGALTGTLRVPLRAGKARFTDLGITRPTRPLPPRLPTSLPFTSDPELASLPTFFTLTFGVNLPGYGHLAVSQNLTVALSGEITLGAPSGGGSDGGGLGASVGMGESIMAVGAPYEESPTSETLVVRCATGVDTSMPPTLSPYVQVIYPSASWVPGVWWLTLYAGGEGGGGGGGGVHGGLAGGVFALSIDATGLISRPIPWDSTADYIAAVIHADLLLPWGVPGWDGSPGKVSVVDASQLIFPPTTSSSTSSFSTSATNTSYRSLAWRITLDTLSSPGPSLTLVNATLSSAWDATLLLLPPTLQLNLSQLHPPAYLGGAFTLATPTATSRPLSPSATASDITTALVGDLGFPATAVSVVGARFDTPVDPFSTTPSSFIRPPLGAFAWHITWGGGDPNYPPPPLLTTNSSGVTLFGGWAATRTVTLMESIWRGARSANHSAMIAQALSPTTTTTTARYEEPMSEHTWLLSWALPFSHPPQLMTTNDPSYFPAALTPHSPPAASPLATPAFFSLVLPGGVTTPLIPVTSTGGELVSALLSTGLVLSANALPLAALNTSLYGTAWLDSTGGGKGGRLNEDTLLQAAWGLGGGVWEGGGTTLAAWVVTVTRVSSSPSSPAAPAQRVRDWATPVSARGNANGVQPQSWGVVLPPSNSSSPSLRAKVISLPNGASQPWRLPPGFTRGDSHGGSGAVHLWCRGGYTNGRVGSTAGPKARDWRACGKLTPTLPFPPLTPGTNYNTAPLLFGATLSLATSTIVPGPVGTGYSSDIFSSWGLSPVPLVPPAAGVLAVSSPGATYWGTSAQQYLSCSNVVSGGFFTLSTTNPSTNTTYTTTPLAWNALGGTIRDALNALPSFWRVDVSPLTSSLCTPNGGLLSPSGYSSLTITFVAPFRGPEPLLGVSTSALLTQPSPPPASATPILFSAHLVNGTLGGEGGVRGAVVLFDAINTFGPVNASAGSPAYSWGNGKGVGLWGEWAQSTVLWSPTALKAVAAAPANHSAVVGEDEFGASLAINLKGLGGRQDVLVVGAPGDKPCTTRGGYASAGVSGSIHVYGRLRYGVFLKGGAFGGVEDINPPPSPSPSPLPTGVNPPTSSPATTVGGGWEFAVTLQGGDAYLEDSGWVGAPGGRFGASVALSSEGDTLAVGAPGWAQVYVYKRQPHLGAPWLFDQVLSGEGAVGSPSSSLPPSFFGASLSWGSNVLAVGAPGASAVQTPPSAASNFGARTGCVAVYHKGGWGSEPRGGKLLLRSSVCPESAKSGDGVGKSVAVSENDGVILVGSVELTASTQAVGNRADGRPTPTSFATFSHPVTPNAPPFPSTTHLMIRVSAPNLSGGGSAAPLTFGGTFTLATSSPRLSRGEEASAHAQFTLKRGGTAATLPTTRIPPHNEHHPTVTASISPAIPFNAPAEMLQDILCASILPQCTFTVERFGPGTLGEYSWVLAFPTPTSNLPPNASTLSAITSTPPLFLHSSRLYLHTPTPPATTPSSPATYHDAWTALSSARARLTQPTRGETSDFVSVVYLGHATAPDTPFRPDSPFSTTCNPTSPTPSRRGCQPWAKTGLVSTAYVLTREAGVEGDSRGMAVGLASGFSADQVSGLGPGVGGWVPSAVLRPHSFQASDGFGWGVAVSPSGRWGGVGAPYRTSPLPAFSTPTNNFPLPSVWGGGFAYPLSWLNAGWGVGGGSTPPSFSPTNASSIAVVSEHSSSRTLNLGLFGGREWAAESNPQLSQPLPYPLPSVSSSTAMLASHYLGPTQVVTFPLSPCTPTCTIPPTLSSPSNYTTSVPSALVGVGYVYDNDPPSPFPYLTYVRTREGNNWGVGGRATISPSGPLALNAALSPATCGGWGSPGCANERAFPWLPLTLVTPLSLDAVEGGDGGCSGVAGGGGGEDCHWIPSPPPSTSVVFDWEGTRDYVSTWGVARTTNTSIVAAAAAAAGDPFSSLPVVFVDDDALEYPDETMWVTVELPGVQPVYGGRLWGGVVIEDDGDGVIGTKAYTARLGYGESGAVAYFARKASSLNATGFGVNDTTGTLLGTLYAPGVNTGAGSLFPPPNPTVSAVGGEGGVVGGEWQHFGESVSLGASGDWAVVATPTEPFYTFTPSVAAAASAQSGAQVPIVDSVIPGVGVVRVLAQVGGAWGATPIQELTPTPVVNDAFFPSPGTKFGSAVATLSVSGVGKFLAVASSGTPSVHLYSWWGNQSVPVGGFSLEAVLIPDLPGASNATPTSLVSSFAVTSGYDSVRVVTAFDGCGAPGTLALAFTPSSTFNASHPDLLVIALGCPGVEAVFMWRHALVNNGNGGGVRQAAFHSPLFPTTPPAPKAALIPSLGVSSTGGQCPMCFSLTPAVGTQLYHVLRSPRVATRGGGVAHPTGFGYSSTFNTPLELVREGFGSAIAASNTTGILVGAPWSGVGVGYVGDAGVAEGKYPPAPYAPRNATPSNTPSRSGVGPTPSPSNTKSPSYILTTSAFPSPLSPLPTPTPSGSPSPSSGGGGPDGMWGGSSSTSPSLSPSPSISPSLLSSHSSQLGDTFSPSTSLSGSPSGSSSTSSSPLGSTTVFLSNRATFTATPTPPGFIPPSIPHPPSRSPYPALGSLSSSVTHTHPPSPPTPTPTPDDALRASAPGAVYYFSTLHPPPPATLPITTTTTTTTTTTPPPFALKLHTILVPPPSAGAAGAGFGSSVALSGDTALVGCPGAANGFSAITWDFESGDLRGWSAIGTAFSRQPTRGDNAGLHPPTSNIPGRPGGGGGGPPIPDHPRGRYYVSTAELHPAPPKGWCKGTEGDFGPGPSWIWSTQPGNTTSTTSTTPDSSTFLPVATGELYTSLPFGLGGAGGSITCGDAATTARVAAERAVGGVGSGILAVGGRGSGGGERSLPPGSTLGDWPTGSLTSLPFIVPSSTLTFLVGGGCDTRTVYVELSVGGIPVRKSSGGCSMGPLSSVLWDTAPWVGSLAIIRIVDAADSGPWGYIAVDEFKWGGRSSSKDVNPSTASVGAVFAYLRAPTVTGDFQPGGSRVVGSNEWVFGGRGGSESPLAGDITVKRMLESSPSREGPLPALPCSPSTIPTPLPPLFYTNFSGCSWYLEARIIPHNGVVGERFGASLAVDETSGLALVGSLGGVGGVGRGVRRFTFAPALTSGQGWLLRGRVWGGATFEGGLEGPWASGFGGSSSPSSTSFSVAASSFPPSVSLASYSALIGGLPAVAAATHLSSLISPLPPLSTVLYVDLGHTYASFSPYDWINPSLFDSASSAAWSASQGGLLPSAWLGSGVVLPSGGALNSGGGVLLPGVFVSVREGGGGASAPNTLLGHVVVPVYRAGVGGFAPLASRGVPLTLRYATIEGSAKGVSARKGAACALLATSARRGAGCGDFVHSAGQLRFGVGVPRMDILVPIMNDECDRGHLPATFTLQLYTPGGGKISGFAGNLTISITEDDTGKAGNC